MASTRPLPHQRPDGRADLHVRISTEAAMALDDEYYRRNMAGLRQTRGDIVDEAIRWVCINRVSLECYTVLNEVVARVEAETGNRPSRATLIDDAVFRVYGRPGEGGPQNDIGPVGRADVGRS